MNKKILISLSIIAAVAAIAIGATSAYFSDVETSTGNTFTTGVLDLELTDSDEFPGEGSDSVSGSIVLDDIKPSACLEEEGWPEEEWYYENYIGIRMKKNSNPGYIYLTLDVSDNGGAISEPECEAESGTWSDGTCSGNTPIDDISSQIVVWGRLGECLDEECIGFDLIEIEGLLGALKDLDGIEEYLGEFQAGEFYFLLLSACLNEDAGNEYQGDQSVVTFTFNAYQNEQD